MANLYSYPASLVLDLDLCQANDCNTITFTDTSTTFLDYGIFWLKIKTIILEIYDEDDALISSNDITSQLITSLTGTITTTNASVSVIGNGTEFSTELSSGDFVIVDNAYFFKVDVVADDDEMTFTTTGDNLSDVEIQKIGTTFTLDATAFGEDISSSIPDGIYKFKYIVTVDYSYLDGVETIDVTDEEHYVEEREILYCNTKCCVERKIVELADKVDDCCLEMNDILDALLAWAQLESLSMQKNCMDSAKLTNTFNKLKDYCQDSSCNCS